MSLSNDLFIHRDYDFPFRASLGEVFKRALCVVEWKYFVDHWLDAFCPEEFTDFGVIPTTNIGHLKY